MIEKMIASTSVAAEMFCPPFNPEGKADHHWLIGPPNGPSSHAHCKKCKLERDFANYRPIIWEDGTTSKINADIYSIDIKNSKLLNKARREAEAKEGGSRIV